MSALEFAKIPMYDENGLVNQAFVEYIAKVKDQLKGSEFEKHFVQIYNIVISTEK